jgi:hypothetical protein
MGVKASTTGELIFEDCPVPAENILRKEGDGFLIALGTVEWDRSTLMAPFLGGLEYALDASVKYAKERVQFGRPIASFQAIQHKLADIEGNYGGHAPVDLPGGLVEGPGEIGRPISLDYSRDLLLMERDSFDGT